MLARALVAWLLIALLESVQGSLRHFVVEPVVGAITAARIGLAISIVLVVVVAWMTTDWIGPPRPRGRLAAGLA